MIQNLAFLGLVVKDVPAATAYFQKLGFTVDEAQSIPNAYTQFKLDGGAIVGLFDSFDVEGVEQNFDPAFLVPDVDTTYEQWQAAGIELLSEPRDMPFGRTFLFRTPDGHILRAYHPPVQ